MASSSDEGEIRDRDAGLEKATTSPQFNDTSVDRQDRPRSRYSTSPSLSIENSITSALRRSADRSRSPRGSKRHRDRDADHYARSRHPRHDPRRFKVYYEDHPSDRRRSVRSYEDLDRGLAAPTGLPYDDRDREQDRDRRRERSRSPYRPSRQSRGAYAPRLHRDGRGDRYVSSDKTRVNGYEYHKSEGSKLQSVSKRTDGPVPTDAPKREAKTVQGSSQRDGANRDLDASR